MKVTARTRAAFGIEVLDPRTAAEPAGWQGFSCRAALPPVWDFELLRREAWLTKNPPVLAVLRRPELTAGRAMLANKSALGFGTRALVSVAVPRPVLGR
jgi:hypothetical protein